MSDKVDINPRLSNHTRIIFFDGVCNLCQRSVQFILTHDKKSIFSFASLQSRFAHEVLKKKNIDPSALNSFILLENDLLYTRSTAALRVAKKLSGAWPLLHLFILVPPFIRNGVYDWIAKHRYRWFGKQEGCWLPRDEWRQRFLS